MALPELATNAAKYGPVGFIRMGCDYLEHDAGLSYAPDLSRQELDSLLVAPRDRQTLPLLRTIARAVSRWRRQVNRRVTG